MITTTEKLRAKVATLSREDLEHFARDVVWSLYATTYCKEDKLMTPKKAAALGIKEGDVVLNSEREWGSDVLPDVDGDVNRAGLNLENL